MNDMKNAIEELRKLCEEKTDKLIKKEQYDKAATDLHDMYESYVAAGFTKEQAWEIVKLIIEKAKL